MIINHQEVWETSQLVEALVTPSPNPHYPHYSNKHVAWSSLSVSSAQRSLVAVTWVRAHVPPQTDRNVTFGPQLVGCGGVTGVGALAPHQGRSGHLGSRQNRFSPSEGQPAQGWETP